MALLAVGAPGRPALLGMAFLAYSLGLRHAFDADHIAAIDNTVRKLVQQGRDSLGVGFYFSLGHSTVVLVMSLAAALAARLVQARLPQFQAAGSVIGTLVSGTFLLAIGALNLLIWLDVLRAFRAARAPGGAPRELPALPGGVIGRLAGPLWRFIDAAWQVYPLGFLFGLGFDTASEVMLLALSAGAAGQAVPWSALLALPVAFAAGMSLLDTADGVFMTRAYAWALATPLRKLYYNLTVTGLSMLVALGVGALELAQVMSAKLGWNAPLWQAVRGVQLGSLGYALVGACLFAWLASLAAWRLLRLEERWSN